MKRVAWIKNAIIDLVVTVLIALLVWQDWRWAEVAVWIYTPLMVALKALALFMGSLGGLAQRQASAPAWLYHVLYAANVALLAIDARWILAGLWVLIWALSVVADRRSSPLAA